jgi:hypothetical protein
VDAVTATTVTRELFASPGPRSLLVVFTVPHLYVGSLALAYSVRRLELPLGAAFSLRRFYLLMGWVPLTFVVLAATVNPRFLTFFVVAAIAGVAGELLVSAAWRWFFGQPIWRYNHRAVLRGATSTLNVLPWALGAALFVVAGRLVQPTPAGVAELWQVAGLASASIAAGAITALVARLVVWRGRAPGVTRGAFAVFCLPVLLTLGVLTAQGHPDHALMMLVFGPLGFGTEYAYGRTMAFFFDRGLWTYEPWPIDEGHSSFVTLPLWMLGGLYFQLIGAALEL